MCFEAVIGTRGVFRPICFTLRKIHSSPSFGPSLALLLSLLPIPFLAGRIPIVHFVREHIDIHVFPKQVRVEGLYIYQNPFPFPVVQGYSIPLPVDSAHPVPVSISATRLSPARRPIPLRHILGEFRFEIPFEAREEVAITIQYSQHAAESNARYLLTTTRPWRRPLVHGSYRLFPQDVQIVGSNYHLENETRGAHSFYREHFMPSEDWHFSWEVHPR